ncbi:MAG: small-conductance mechanosensitive channel [Anabaena sp. CRKS33]|nr:MAG: small-conductance mechanosensitive channel [Anabaena sp. CRKS33]
MSIEESQTPEPIDEWLEQIAVQPPENQPPETLLADLELEAEVSKPEIAFNSDTIDPKTLTAENLNLLNTQAAAQVNQLQQVKSDLKAEIGQLEVTYKTLQTQISVTQTALSQVVQESLSQLEQRKQALQISVEQLERRQERIRNEMRTSFAGTSQDIAIRVQGFKDYLTGSLQDLAAATEQMQLLQPAKEREKPAPKEVKSVKEKLEVPQLGQQQFQDTTKKIRRLLDQYRNQPDYYGPPWQLRRTFEPIHAEKLSNWLFVLGGRGALRTMGSRLQNILIASSAISILHEIYGDRLRTLILANTPERLGEWRRGLQDCLGIGRSDFGPDRGVVLFEASTALAQKADRLVKANEMPLIIIDDSEEQISLGLLQFPLWLAFAPDPKTMKDRDFDDDF